MIDLLVRDEGVGTRISNRYSLNRSLNDTHDKPLADAEIHAAVSLCVHHSLEGEHVHALIYKEP